MPRKKPAALGVRPPAHFFQKELGGETPLSFETAAGLCAEAARLLQASPWDTLEEDEVVFATWAGAAATYTCSILGAIGEVFALVVYSGPEGFHFFRDLHEGDESDYDKFIYGVGWQIGRASCRERVWISVGGVPLYEYGSCTNRCSL